MAVIRGYKIYKKGLENQFLGKQEVRKNYEMYEMPVYQTTGYHYCERLEDTLRYYDAMNDEVDICDVVGFGDIATFYDSYNDYEIIVSNHLRILRVLSREEIIKYINELSDDDRVCRFISGFKLTPEEIDFLVINHPSEKVQKFINYYQLGDKHAFERN